VHHKEKTPPRVVFFSYGTPMGTNSHSHSEGDVRIPLAVSASRGAESKRHTKAKRMAESYHEQHIPEKICLALVEEHHLAWCFFLMVRPWERTPIRKAKGMFAYRLRYLRREEQIAEDKQKRNVWQKATPSSISLKHFSIQLLSKHRPVWCFLLFTKKSII